MRLLNVLLDLTDKLDVFCCSFSTQNTASLYLLFGTRDYTKQIYIDVHFFYFKLFLEVLSKNQFGILVLPD